MSTRPSEETTTPAAHPSTPPGYKRRRNTVITITILLAFAYGLQMYSPVPAFNDLSAEFSLNYTQVGLLISVFFFGYAAGHIPAGFAAAAYGLKRVAVVGAFVLALSTLMFAFANGYGMMLLSRGIGGVAMSLMAGAAFPLATAWSPPKYTRLIVGGLMNGVGFTGGSAVGLYVWTILVENIGWRSSSLCAAAFGLVVAILAWIFIRIPAKYGELEGGSFDWRSTGKVLRSRSMWAIGIGSAGAYGALFTVSQLGPGYAETEFSFSAETASLLGVVMLLLGIPGALIGGAIADNAKRFLPVLWIPAAILIVLLFLIPFSGEVMIWIVLAGIGLIGTLYFSPATVSPSEYPDEIPPKDFATAFGLVLTLGNLGAVLYPFIYTSGADLVGRNASWWFLAAASALTFIGFFFAKEPRTDARRAAAKAPASTEK